MAKEPNLPEGTDHVIDTNADGASGTANGVSVAKEDASAGTVREAAESIKDNVREQISSLKSQATEKAHSFADTGKGQATDILKNVAQVVREASESVESRLGDKYSGLGFKAADSVNNFAGTLEDKSVDELIEDAKAFVRRSPAVAIGIAAVAGFALARILRSSLDELNAGRNGAGAGAD